MGRAPADRLGCPHRRPPARPAIGDKRPCGLLWHNAGGRRQRGCQEPARGPLLPPCRWHPRRHAGPQSVAGFHLSASGPGYVDAGSGHGVEAALPALAGGAAGPGHGQRHGAGAAAGADTAEPRRARQGLRNAGQPEEPDPGIRDALVGQPEASGWLRGSHHFRLPATGHCDRGPLHDPRVRNRGRARHRVDLSADGPGPGC
mmetsp:Transcript_24384/g.69907  ORF Transcript_24384/g.69907 Transcript_24384/m.69907 type:complete len:202 (+) Transcript_24384:844-1449(+)